MKPDHFDISKYEIYHFDAWRCQKSVVFLGSQINLVCFLLFLSVKLPHIEFRQSFAKPQFAALYWIEALFSLFLHSPLWYEYIALHLRGFEPN